MESSGYKTENMHAQNSSMKYNSIRFTRPDAFHFVLLAGDLFPLEFLLRLLSVPIESFETQTRALNHWFSGYGVWQVRQASCPTRTYSALSERDATNLVSRFFAQ